VAAACGTIEGAAITIPPANIIVISVRLVNLRPISLLDNNIIRILSHFNFLSAYTFVICLKDRFTYFKIEYSVYQLIDDRSIKSTSNNPISFSVESETLDLRRQ
jgi:hypothetical protein